MVRLPQAKRPRANPGQPFLQEKKKNSIALEHLHLQPRKITDTRRERSGQTQVSPFLDWTKKRTSGQFFPQLGEKEKRTPWSSHIGKLLSSRDPKKTPVEL